MNDREQIINNLKALLKGMDRDSCVEMVFLYGSWARGFPRLDSDIDLAVVFSRELSCEDESFERITDLCLSLCRELRREVNIIQIHRDFRRPMLYYNAVVLGIPLYVRTREDYIALKNEAIHQMEDFSLFGLRWQYQTAKKNLEAVDHA